MSSEFIMIKIDAEVDLKLKKLERYCERYLRYPRAIIFIGDPYGKTNNPEQAILWHIKAS